MHWICKQKNLLIKEMQNKKKYITLTIFMVVIYSLIVNPLRAFENKYNDNRNHKFTKFSSAKKEVYRIASDRKTFYCGCSYDANKIINLEKCGYQVRKSKKRASHVEVEHVVPADKLCGKTQEWLRGSDACMDHKGHSYKGRRCASENNPSCIMAYNDLHNLRPAIGEINNDRSDFSFGDIEQHDHNYGACSFKIKNRVVDPPREVHGDIARIYLHMNAAYPELNILTEDEVEFFKIWSQTDPVTIAECRQNQKIFSVQGTSNLVVKEQCKESGFK